MRWLFLSLSFAATLAASEGHAQDARRIGVTATGCDSPTVVGKTSCPEASSRPRQPEPPPKPAPSHALAATVPSPAPASTETAKADPIIGGVKESEVDKYLANYGKPPREAVRAMLNPSDENVAALLKRENEQLAVVSYLANRRVELGQVAAQLSGRSELSQTDLPSLIGMRAVAIVSPDCANCTALLKALNQLVTEFPSVDGRVAVVGQYDQRQFVVKASGLGVFLPISSIPPTRVQQYGIQQLPALVIGDTRYGAEAAVITEIQSALDIEMKLVEFRKANERAAPRKGTQPFVGAQK